MTPKERIYVAIDTPDINRATKLARLLSGEVGGIKIGKELFTAQGPNAVRGAVGGEPLFVDLKFHDIPNTVAGAIRSSLHMRPFMVNVHASGGKAMMQAAVEAARETSEDLGIPRPLVLAVTVLTSLDDTDLSDVGQKGPAADQVKRLALLAQESGIDGVVCSSREITLLRETCGPDFKLVVPGIRPTWAAVGDQKRIMTPKDAVAAGADYLVIGRPITGAEDPVAAARRIVEELEA
ncbi:orotidine-5'-phosphate decarboxylase [Kiloniella antarctica]|uniref:Orotidine 5'-phosphate decarboxylase n=1 Tax=Kiloniella antarctica TaxID=1550907 RepID=A0ABW5BFB8_9PROT